MQIQIKNRFSAEIIFEGEFESLSKAVEIVVKKIASLRGANLRGANLRGANLRGADLQGADLQGADLWGADLWNADLRGANLQGANLRGADLQGADLQGADLWNADLRGANLQGANLRGADLQGANLRGANLQGANLRGADLRGADLRGANLWNANLWNANLWNADLQGADLWGAMDIDLRIAQTRILPEGDIIGYKKCMNNVIVKLKIPANAKRSHAFGRKCRAEFAEVLEIFGAETAVSAYNRRTIYKVGEIVRPDKWSDDWRNECDSGIHFFITKIEAENY